MIVGLGWLLLQKINLTRVLGSALTASVLFFLLSNFGVWLGSTMYPPTGEGLMLCYAAGIPFFWKSVLGTVGFSLVFFSTYEWATSHRLLWEKAWLAKVAVHILIKDPTWDLSGSHPWPGLFFDSTCWKLTFSLNASFHSWTAVHSIISSKYFFHHQGVNWTDLWWGALVAYELWCSAG